jgi:alkaline phosphatase D
MALTNRRGLAAGLALALLAAAATLPGPAAGRETDKKPISRIAFGSCAHQDRPQPIWGPIVAARPELFLFLGDTVYADTEDMKVMRAKYAKLAALPGYQRLLKTCPVLATWDDHDFGVNDGGAEYPKKRESQQVFLDFFGVPKDSPRRKQEGVYHAEVFGPPGKRVQVILLDTRYFRSPLVKGPRPPRGPAPYVPTKDQKSTILGAAQWKWLQAQLAVPAEVRLLCSSIQLVPEDHGFEKWMNFPHERQRLFDLLRQTKAAGVVVLSGDRHLGELSVMDAGLGYPLFDLTSSGLNQGNRRWRALEKNRHRVATMNVGNNFGLVTIDWGKADPLIRLQLRDEEGEVTVQQKVPLSRLRPGRPGGPGLAGEARKHVGKEHTLELQVRSVGKSRTGALVFLNSAEDFRDEGNFTVVLDVKALAAALQKAKIDDPAAHFRGKRVRLRGTVTLFNDRPQIVVKDLAQLRVIEK